MPEITWKPDGFTASTIHNNIENGSFVVPLYQRGLVWNPRQKDAFVDTLKKGYPFGSILLYFDDSIGKYQIIDGLQRCSTIYEFVKSPAEYFSDDDIEESVPIQLSKITGVVNGNNETFLTGIRDHLKKWVHDSFETMDDVRDIQYFEYATAFIRDYPSAIGHEAEIITAVKPTLKKYKDLCEGLCDVKIPALIIQGNDEYLPEIFERINNRGTSLSKYQVYAATWTKKYSISSNECSDLIRYNKERYEKMSAEGADLVDFDSITFSNSKQLNLFEIAFGLGKKLGHDYSHLFPVKNELTDIDSVGFSLITSCLGMRNADSKKLNAQFDALAGADNADLLIKRILQCVDTANKLIGKFNIFKLNSYTTVGPLHTEFQIVSLIANIFIKRYASYRKDDNDRITDFQLHLSASDPDWNRYENTLKENASKRYCIDILQQRWKGSGDNRLNSTMFDQDYYSRSYPWDEFKMNLELWFSTMNNERREYKKVSNPAEPEKLFLAILYLPILSALNQVDASKYDVEHLATKNLMKKNLDRYNGELKLPIGSIGNLCLLPQKENRSKKDKTLYDDDRYLRRSKYCLSDIESKFSFTTADDFTWLNTTTWSKDEFETKYRAYLDTRFNRLIDKIKANYSAL